MSGFGIVLCIMLIVYVRPSVLGFNGVDRMEINSIVGMLTMLLEDQAAFNNSLSICETHIENLKNTVWNIEEKMKSMRLELEAMQCNVNMAPTITLKPKNISVVQNTIASFFCEANSQLHWEIDGKKINPARKRYGIFPYLNGTELRIDNVKKKFNNTVITCVASNEHGMTRANASLGVYGNNADVAGFPKITKNPESVRLSVGQTASLRCAAETTLDEPVNIHWFKDRTSVNTSDPRIHTDVSGTLTIENVRTSDQGKYECLAVNSEGMTNSLAAMVYVKEGPVIEMSETNVTVQEGERAVLTCAVDNLGGHKVVWTGEWSNLLTLDDRRVHDDPRMSIERPSKRDWNLFIRNTTYTDRGKYTCQVNTNPVQTKIVFLNVKDKSTQKPMTAPRNVTARSLSRDSILIEWEEPETIIDVITGYAILYTTTPEYPVNLWHKLEISGNNRNYTITDLLPNDKYTLTVYAFSRNGIGPMSEPVQVLTRDREPLLKSRNVQTTSISPGEITVSWDKLSEVDQIEGYILHYNSSYEDSTGNVTIPNSDSMFTITNLIPSTIYHIQLEAIGVNGERTISETVQEKTQEFIPKEPRNVRSRVVNATTIHVEWRPPLPKTQKQFIPNYFVTCYQLDQFGNYVYEDRHEVTTQNGDITEVVLYDLKPNTEYAVSVWANTRAGNGIRSKESYINTRLYDGPLIDMSKTNVTVQEGERAVLTCAVDNLGGHKVIWIDQSSILLTHDARRIVNDPRITVERPYMRDWTLHIRNTTFRDQGNYTCKINTYPVQTKTVVLNVIATPKLDGSESYVTVREGETAILTCVVHYLGEHKVVWSDEWFTLLTLDDRRVHDDPRMSIERPTKRDWNLFIRNTTSKDRGKYTCEINTNPVQTKTVFLNIREKSTETHMTAPRNVTASELSLDSILIEWEEPDTINDIITGYAILYTTTPEYPVNLWHKLEISGNNRNYAITDLLPNDKYTLTVYAFSRSGIGPMSEHVQVLTRGREPLLKPRNVQTKSISPGEITVSWDKVSEVDKIEGYILHYNSSYEDSTGNVTIPNSDSMFTITNLIPSTIYHVQLEAIGANGERTISETVQEKTQEFIPKEPRNVRRRVVNATTIHVEWRPPLPKTLTQFISNYIVTCYQLDQFGNHVYEDRHEVTTQNGDITEAVLYDLKPNTEYAVSVSANTRAGNGIHSEMSYISTRLYVPSEPRNVSAEVLKENPWIFKITWSEPEYTGGDITRYKIVSPVHKMERILAPGLRTFITPEMTSPDQINGVQIYAGNSIGYGPAASIYFTG